MSSIRLGAAAFVLDHEGRLLLGRRGKEPNYGLWVLPGGAVLDGEPWQEALEREVWEEASLSVRARSNQLPHVSQIFGADGEHRVVLCGFADLRDDPARLKASSDLLEARFFARSEIPWDEVSPAIRQTVEAMLEDAFRPTSRSFGAQISEGALANSVRNHERARNVAWIRKRADEYRAMNYDVGVSWLEELADELEALPRGVA